MAIIDLNDIYRIDYRSERGQLDPLYLQENVRSALQHRLATPQGKMPFNAFYGNRLKSYVGETVTPELINSVSQEIDTQIRRDFRVRNVESIEIETIDQNSIVCNVSLTLINLQDNLEFRLVI